MQKISSLSQVPLAALKRTLNSAQLTLRHLQLPPKQDNWQTWLLLGGRGSGKTRAGSAWVHGLATGVRPFAAKPTGPIALVGETVADVREVMIEGPAGIRQNALYEQPRYEATRRRLIWPNGMVAEVFSAHDPESLRGPQFSAAWCDELCKWPYAQECWDMLQFGLRLGGWPRQLVTTTPKPIALLKALMADDLTQTHRMRTIDNRENLAPNFIHNMVKRYGNSRLGRQELDGEIIEAREGALWSRELLEMHRLQNRPDLQRIVVAIDPPATAKATSDACGIVIAGCDASGHAYVLADRTIGAAAPNVWASRAIGEYHAWQADKILAEVNQGGDMVVSVLRTIDPALPVLSVRANRGKWLRAEPVAALYEQGRVHHIGMFAELEDEMCDFTTDGLSSRKSPDRMDACVWAVGELLLGNQGKPKIRAL